MPTISVFFGIIIRMYWRDHAPPLIHAYYQGHHALIAIETGSTIGGHLPARAEILVRDWVLSCQWGRARQMLAVQKVAGADSE